MSLAPGHHVRPRCPPWTWQRLCLLLHSQGRQRLQRVRGLPHLKDTGNATTGVLWQKVLLAEAMKRGVAGQGPVARSRPSPCWEPAQSPVSLALVVEQWQQLEALEAELQELWLRTQEQHDYTAAITWQLKAALEKQRQLLLERLQYEWEQQWAKKVRRLQELNL